jgi:hypothetical protein
MGTEYAWVWEITIQALSDGTTLKLPFK